MWHIHRLQQGKCWWKRIPKAYTWKRRSQGRKEKKRNNECAEKDGAVIVFYINLQKVICHRLCKPALVITKVNYVQRTTQFKTRRVRQQDVMFGMSQRVTFYPTRFPDVDPYMHVCLEVSFHTLKWRGIQFRFLTRI